MSTNAKTGALPRGFRAGKLGLSLVGSYLGYQAQNLVLGEKDRPQRKARLQTRAARRMRKEFGVMKGAAMKFGQLLSLQGEMLPEEALDELAQLQMHAPGMHPTLARAQFKSSLGKDPEELFRHFEPEPFAAASLGQVHRARTFKGESVVVKIQYPAIRSAIENDFKLLRSATLPGQLSGHIPAALLDEFQRGILEETDYIHEADNLECFAQGLSSVEFVSIPRVYRQWSAERVLTMSFLEGETIGDFLKRKPDQEMRDLIGSRLAELWETQCIRLRALHADHHPGNYLFRPDGTIGMIDFGCVKRISFNPRELRRWYEQRLWRQSEAAARQFLKMIYDPNASYARARKGLPLIEELADMYYPTTDGAEVVLDYSDPRRIAMFTESGKRHGMLILRDKLFNPEFAFFSRASIGLHHLLRELGAKINLTAIHRNVDAKTADVP